MTQTPGNANICNACGQTTRECKCYTNPVATWSGMAAPEEMAASGEIIRERYQVIRSLGSGATATVFLVRHLQTDGLYAMKMLNRDVPNMAEAQKRFEREATAISQLQHKNMVELYDFGMTNNGHVYFITDFVQGTSLYNILLEEGPMAYPRACNIFVQICDAMEYAHTHGLIHRDLKSANILIINDPAQDINDSVRIVDFGIVKFKQDATNQQSQKLTQEGTVVGSPKYMSPEQCQGKQQDPRSDIYSLGCLMHEVLTGKCPFDADYPFAILIKQVTEPLPPINQRFPELNIPQALARIVETALEKQPDARFQTMRDLQNALLAFSLKHTQS